MIRIAVELNGVVRNVNKQILKYYQKDFDQSVDLDNVNEDDDPFKVAKFNSRKERNEFVYVDYPYEIFGCAKTMNKDLPTDMTYWLSNLTNYEDDEVKVILYSLNEESLTIQSTYFFLSRIGTRVREVIFPRSIDELIDRCDVIITADGKVVDEVDGRKYTILINNSINAEYKDKTDKNYNSLNEVMKDETLLSELYKNTHKDGKTGEE